MPPRRCDIELHKYLCISEKYKTIVVYYLVQESSYEYAIFLSKYFITVLQWVYIYGRKEVLYYKCKLCYETHVFTNKTRNFINTFELPVYNVRSSHIFVSVTLPYLWKTKKPISLCFVYNWCAMNTIQYTNLYLISSNI